MKYRLALQLFRIHNASNENDDWIDLNFQQNFNDRNNHVKVHDTSKLLIEKNRIVNRPTCINNTKEYDWLNESFTSFKIKCKSKFLKRHNNLLTLHV